MTRRGLSFNEMFLTNGGHPPLLKLFIRGEIELETIIILDMVLKFVVRWDEQLADPLWSNLSLKIRKYKPFMSIPVKEYRTLMRGIFT